MTQEIEIEYKNLLTKQEFDRLLTAYSFPKQCQIQTNYYFDTKNFSLAKNRCALRIRKKNDHFRLTLKQPHPSGILETHDTLTPKEALAWIEGDIINKPNISKQLEEINVSIAQMICYGSLTTHRYETHFKNSLFVLDYSMYNGYSDYELEIESPNETIGIKAFNTILEENNIISRKTPTKMERFFTTL